MQELRIYISWLLSELFVSEILFAVVLLNWLGGAHLGETQGGDPYTGERKGPLSLVVV